VDVNEYSVMLTSKKQIPSWLEGNITIVWIRQMRAESDQTGELFYEFTTNESSA
jgi:riboflavin kinase/FMN adenylyltransferase